MNNASNTIAIIKALIIFLLFNNQLGDPAGDSVDDDGAPEPGSCLITKEKCSRCELMPLSFSRA